MDWYAWLSRAGLGEAHAAEYALLFARDDLAADDLPRLDHASLAAIGVPLAKHRLQILTLARKQPSSSSAAAAAITVLPGRATRLLAAAARSLAGRLRSAVLRRDSKAAAVAPRPVPPLRHHRGGTGGAAAGAGAGAGAGPPWKSCRAPAADKRGGRATTTKLALVACLSKPMVTLIDGGGKGKKKRTAKPTVPGCFASTETRSDCDYDADEDEEYDDEMGGGGCSPETPWESMFQDLNPT